MLSTAGLGVLGLYLDEQDRKNRKVLRKKDRKVSEHNIPSNNNIYESKRVKHDRHNERLAAKKSYEKAQNPRETNVIPPFFNDRYVQNRVMKQDISDDAYTLLKNDNTNENFENLSGNMGNRVIESFSDNDSVFSDDGTYNDNRSTKSNHSGISVLSNNSVDLSDPTALFTASDKLSDNNYIKYRKDTYKCDKKKPNFISQFEPLTFDNPGNPVSQNNTSKNNSQTKKTEMERNLALADGYSNFDMGDDMTYGVTNVEHFTHDNQTPYFSGGKGYGNDFVSQMALDNVKDRKRNLFTGSSDYLDYRPKTERRPLFNPQVGLTNIYGMPNFTEFLSARYIPGRERRNEYPTEQVRITPGLNIGYFEKGKQGYHDTFRPMPRSVDELRTANNQKITYGGVVIPGMKGYKRSTLPNMYKRKPDTYTENDPRDLQKSLGYIRGPTIRSNYDLPATNKEQTHTYRVGGGASKTDHHLPEYMLPLVHRTHKQNYLQPTPRNAAYSESFKAKPNVKSYHVPQNERSSTQFVEHYGPFGHVEAQQGQADAFNRSDVPDPTMKDIHVNQNWIARANQGELYQGPATSFNRKDVPDPTMRDIHVNQNWVGGMDNKAWRKGQSDSFNRQDVPDPTMRDIHGNQNWIGGMDNKAWTKGQADSFNRQDVPDPTMRDVHVNQNWIGGMDNKARNKGQSDSFNRKDVPDPTMRDVHVNQNWVGGMDNKAWRKGQASSFNRKDVPDPTMRDVHVNQNWVGAMDNKAWRKGQSDSFNRKDVPDPTMRDVHVNQNWIGAMHNKAWRKGQASSFNRKDVPDPTMRDIHAEQNWIAGVGTKDNLKSTADAFNRKDVPDPTMRDVYIDQNWVGGAGNKEHTQGHAFNMKDIPDPTMRDVYIDQNWVGGAGNKEHTQGHAFNMKDVPDPTLRDMTIHKNHVQPTLLKMDGGYQVEQQGTRVPVTQRQTYINNTYQQPMLRKLDAGYDVEQQGTHIPVTNRQTYINNNYQQPVSQKFDGGYMVEEKGTHVPITLKQQLHVPYHGGVGNKSHSHQMSRSAENNAFLDDRRQQINMAADRAPTTSNFNKGPTFEYTQMTVCEPIQLNREVYGTAYNQNPLQGVPTVYTQNGNTLPQQSWRFDKHVVDNLQNNPYVNNTQHRSLT